MDGIGARWLGPWGSGIAETPAINRLATECLLVENAHAIHGSPARQFAAWLNATGSGPLPLFQEMRAAGKSLVAFTDCPEFARQAEPVFDEVVEVQTPVATKPAAGLLATALAGFAASAGELWKVLPAADTLLWIHSRGLTLPWDAPWDLRLSSKGDDDPDPPASVVPPEMETDSASPEGRDLTAGWQQALAAQIVVVDHAIGLLLESIVESMHESGGDLPLLAVTGTGAWGMGEHGRIGPPQAGLFYDEYLHVPLLLRFPDLPKGSLRVPQLMSADRLVILLAGWLAGAPAESLGDWSVVPNRQRQAIWKRNGGGAFLRTHGWKWIEHGEQRELYLKPDDRWEQNNVADRCPDVVESLALLLAGLPSLSDGQLPDGHPPLEDLLAWGVG